MNSRSSNIIPNVFSGYRIMVIIPPCHGGDTGSTPVTRSANEKSIGRGSF